MTAALVAEWTRLRDAYAADYHDAQKFERMSFFENWHRDALLALASRAVDAERLLARAKIERAAIVLILAMLTGVAHADSLPAPELRPPELPRLIINGMACVVVEDNVIECDGAVGGARGWTSTTQPTFPRCPDDRELVADSHMQPKCAPAGSLTDPLK